MWLVTPKPDEALPNEHASDKGSIHIVNYPDTDVARSYVHGMAAYVGLSHEQAEALEKAFVEWRNRKNILSGELKKEFSDAIEKRKHDPLLLIHLSEKEKDGMYKRDYTSLWFFSNKPPQKAIEFNFLDAESGFSRILIKIMRQISQAIGDGQREGCDVSKILKDAVRDNAETVIKYAIENATQHNNGNDISLPVGSSVFYDARNKEVVIQIIGGGITKLKVNQNDIFYASQGKPSRSISKSISHLSSGLTYMFSALSRLAIGNYKEPSIRWYNLSYKLSEYKDHPYNPVVTEIRIPLENKNVASEGSPSPVFKLLSTGELSDGPHTREEILNALNKERKLHGQKEIGERTIQLDLAFLIKAGVIERVKIKGVTHYQLRPEITGRKDLIQEILDREFKRGMITENLRIPKNRKRIAVEIQIIVKMQKEKDITINKVIEELGVKRGVVRSALKSLVKNHVLIKQGEGIYRWTVSGGSGEDEIDEHVLAHEHRRHEADQLVTEGEAARQQGQYRTARNAWETAKSIYENIGEDKLAKSLQNMLNDLEKEAASKNSSKSSPRVGNVEQVVDANHAFEVGEYDKAYNLLMQGLLGEEFVNNIELAHKILFLLSISFGGTPKGTVTFEISKIVGRYLKTTDQTGMKRELREYVIANPIWYSLFQSLSDLEITPVLFIDTEVVKNPVGFKEALHQLRNKEGNIPILLLAEKSEDYRVSIRAKLVELGIDLTNVRFETRKSLGLQDFELNKVMSPILGIDNLRCVPLTNSICDTYKALQKARDQV